MKSQGEQLELAKKSFYGNNGEIENIGKQMNRIKKRILSNPDQESVKEVIPVWEKRLVYLDDQIVQLTDNNKQLTRMIAESSEQKESIAKQKEEKENEHIKLKLEIEQFENAHVKIKEVLGALRTQWVSLDSIYLRQDSLTQQMVDYSHRLLKERDHSLYKERLAHRFLDDYGTQDLFFADPFVEKQLKQWGDQFNLLETGVQFIQSLGDTITEEVKNYPLWRLR